MVEGIFGVALRSPSIFEFKVRGDSNGEELIGPFHKERFSTFCKFRVKHPSSSKAVRDVVNDVFGDLDPKLGAVGGLVDFGKSCIHSVFEVFEIFLSGQSVHDVPLMGWREFRGRLDSGMVFGRPFVVRKPTIRLLEVWKICSGWSSPESLLESSVFPSGRRAEGLKVSSCGGV